MLHRQRYGKPIQLIWNGDTTNWKNKFWIQQGCDNEIINDVNVW